MFCFLNALQKHPKTLSHKLFPIVTPRQGLFSDPRQEQDELWVLSPFRYVTKGNTSCGDLHHSTQKLWKFRALCILHSKLQGNRSLCLCMHGRDKMP